MDQNVLYFIIFSIPAISSSICLCILSFYRKGNIPEVEKRLTGLIKLAFLLRIFCWVIGLTYFYNTPVYAHFSALYLTLNLVSLVVLCHCIALITRTDPGKTFSPLYYAIPILLGVTYQAEIVSIPEDILVRIYTNRGIVVPGYESFSHKINNGIYTRVAFALVCSWVCFRNIRRYRKFIVNYSADVSRSSISWVKLFTIMMLTVSVMVGLGTGTFVVKYPLVILLPVCILFFQHILLCVNACKRNYEIVWPQLAESTAEGCGQHTDTKINKGYFEDYIRNEQPFRDPTLRITDMTRALGTNRTYLSEFVNREYGMNFSTYINLLRLEEFERIQSAPDTTLSNLELIEQVGFGSYDSYMRTKKRRDDLFSRSSHQNNRKVA